MDDQEFPELHYDEGTLTKAYKNNSMICLLNNPKLYSDLFDSHYKWDKKDVREDENKFPIDYHLDYLLAEEDQ